VANAMEMPQVRLMLWVVHRGKQGHKVEQRSAARILDLGWRIYPKTRGGGRR